MNEVKGFRVRGFFICALTGALSLWAGAARSFTFDFPAGLVCEFPLQVDANDSNFHVKEFKNGRILSAGRGFALTFTNVDTGDTFSLKSKWFRHTHDSQSGRDTDGCLDGA